MKKHFVFLLMNFFVVGNLFAQHRGENWCFADSCGINFTGGSPISFNSALINSVSSMHPVEGQACISDSNGNLQFYTNGFLLWDKQNQLFPHMLNNGCSFSTTNGILCLPFPNSNSLVAVIYLHVVTTDTMGLYYSVVDMNKRGGLGDIDTTKWDVPVMILDTVDERLTAIKHANGRDWWIIMQVGNSFYKSLLTPSGIQFIDEQQIGNGVKYEFGEPGEICASPNGDKILRVSIDGKAEIFDFDRCEGTLSNQITLENFIISASHWSYYGCALSPNGNMIYISCFDTLYQYCYNNGNYDKNIIWIDTNFIMPPAPGGYCMWQMELAPDNKIYIGSSRVLYPTQVFSPYNQNLCVINNPDSCGNACDFQPYSFYLNGNRTTVGLPNMPNYNLGALEGSACDTLTSIQNENLKTKNIVSIYPNPATNKLTVELVGSQQYAVNRIEITNSLGVTVYAESGNLKSQIIYLKSFPSGIYFIKLYFADGGMEVKKFVME